MIRELIGSMGSPYLNSGETIVLTTNRVVVDAIAYDVMLTTARIIFIDNRNPRFEPGRARSPLSSRCREERPLQMIRSLRYCSARKKGGDARPPLNLVFSQNPGENRKPERDEWVRTIIQMSIACAGEADRGRSAPGTGTGQETGDCNRRCDAVLRRTGSARSRTWVILIRATPAHHSGDA